jgi:uncharacterized membrane protein SirB2
MLKSFHVMLAYVTTIGFLIRGFWSIMDSPLKGHRWVRIAPHVVDTALLILGVTLVFQIGASLSDGWLAAKLLALVGYIGFGVLTMRATSRALRISGFVAALACVAYMFAVALTRAPWPFAAA